MSRYHCTTGSEFILAIISPVCFCGLYSYHTFIKMTHSGRMRFVIRLTLANSLAYLGVLSVGNCLEEVL